MNYDKYFELLNNQEKKKEKKECCENKQLILIDNFYTCENCGIVDTNDDYEKLDNEKFRDKLNPKYQLTTKIEYKSKYKNLLRIQKWMSYDYQENTANNSYKEIKKIGKKYNIPINILDISCVNYNDIYIKKNISSRNKIKKSIYIYCIYKEAIFYNENLNIFLILKDNNLSINNFNNCLTKLNENNFFLNENMENYIKLTKENYDIEINIYELIKKYNENINVKNNKKINKNSILIYIFYEIIKPKDDKKFIKIFNITKMTFNKIINKYIYN